MLNQLAISNKIKLKKCDSRDMVGQKAVVLIPNILSSNMFGIFKFVKSQRSKNTC